MGDNLKPLHPNPFTGGNNEIPKSFPDSGCRWNYGIDCISLIFEGCCIFHIDFLMIALKNNKTFLSVLNAASSVIWGGLGCVVTVLEAGRILSGNHTKDVDLWDILLLLDGIILILAAILIWNRRRVVKMIVGLFAYLCSFFVLFTVSLAAAAGHWPPLRFYLVILIPVVGFLLSILSLFCLPPKNSKQVIAEEQVSR